MFGYKHHQREKKADAPTPPTHRHMILIILLVAPIINIYAVVNDMHPLHWTALGLFIIFAATYDLRKRTLSLALIFMQLACMLNIGLLLVPYAISMAGFVFITVFNDRRDPQCSAPLLSATDPSSETPCASTTTELCARPASYAIGAPSAKPSADTTTEPDASSRSQGAPVVAWSS